MWRKHIDLPCLDIDGHQWTMNGQVLKMLEELGEVSQALNKHKDLDRTAAETLDFIMTGVTMLNMLEFHGVDIDYHFEKLLDKLKDKKYLLEICDKKIIPVIKDIKWYGGKE